jgi:predicted extracellular nuclease
MVALSVGCSGLQPTVEPPASPTARDLHQPIRRLAFLGEAVLDGNLEFEGTTVGGLSALTYDADENLYYALSDDPSYRDPTRIYGLEINLDDGTLETGDVTVESLIVLRDADGNTFPTYAVDGEGLAISSNGSFFISSEGNVDRGVQPFVREITSDGSPKRELALPKRYLSTGKGRRGVRHNLAFEALTLTPEGSWLFAGVENALIQDGPEADIDRPSPGRILRFDLLGGQQPTEYLYWIDPIHHAPTQPDGFRVNGLVELLALEGDQLLALERAFSAGVGNTVRLFLVDLAGADDIRDLDLGHGASDVRPAKKTLLLDLADLGLTLDNVEGLTHGPSLPDGRHTFFLISDNNFSPRQKTQVLAFAWSHHSVTLSQIQGPGHRSPHEGEWVFGVEGVVTAVEGGDSTARAWLQEAIGDSDRSTSGGLSFETPEPVDLSPGDHLRLSGRVIEHSQTGNLSVTRLRTATVETLSRGRPLPPPVALGSSIPRQFDDDGLADFEPWNDAIDFYESFEGMRVEVPSALVVGAPSRFGDFVVLPNRGSGLGPRTATGGILLTAESGNPQRLQIDPRLLSADQRMGLDSTRVGATVTGPLVGVLDYSFGAYEIVLTEPPGEVSAVASPGDPTSLSGSKTGLTIGTFNVENLDALDSADKYSRVVQTIIHGLGAPDILGLQEIQDDNGAVDDGVVSAAGTLERLIREVVTAGGPLYDFHQVDPANNADGGQPGYNIRVAYLINPLRVTVTRRGEPDALSSAALEALGDGVLLVPNPARVAASDAAFAHDENLDYDASRKALALQVEFAGHQLFLINAHLKSKRGDGGLFGSAQPPGRRSERQRLEQARRLRSFVSEIQTAQPDAAIVLLGDLNEHEFRAPVLELADSTLVNLIHQVPIADRYTYNYRGNSQVLDHILVSPSLAERASPEIDIVHVNADVAAGRRASDHDPVVVRLEMSDF